MGACVLRLGRRSKETAPPPTQATPPQPNPTQPAIALLSLPVASWPEPPRPEPKGAAFPEPRPRQIDRLVVRFLGRESEEAAREEMCPLRVILIFLSATVAGFFLIRGLNAEPDQFDADADDSGSPRGPLPLHSKVTPTDAPRPFPFPLRLPPPYS